MAGGKDDGEKPSGGVFGLFFGQKKRIKSGYMGEKLDFYFNEELKCWVERGKEHEVQAGGVPPPPPRPSSRMNDAPASVDSEDKGSLSTHARYAVPGGGMAKAPSRGSLAPPLGGLAAPAQSGPPPKFFVPAPVPAEPAASEDGPEAEPKRVQDAQRVFTPGAPAAGVSEAPQTVADSSDGDLPRGAASPAGALGASRAPEVPLSPQSAAQLAAEGAASDVMPMHEDAALYAEYPGQNAYQQPQPVGAAAQEYAHAEQPQDADFAPEGGAAVVLDGDGSLEASVYDQANGIANGAVANGAERASFAPSYEMISVNSEVPAEEEVIDYSTWDADYWAQCFEADPKTFYHHFYYAKQQEGWTAEDWARYEAEEPAHYSWLSYFLSQGMDDSAAQYDGGFASTEVDASQQIHDAANVQPDAALMLDGHMAAHTDEHDGLGREGLSLSGEHVASLHAAEAPLENGKPEINGYSLHEQTNGHGPGESAGAHHSEPANGFLEQAAERGGGSGGGAEIKPTGSAGARAHSSAGWADLEGSSGVTWVDPDASAEILRSAQEHWVAPEDGPAGDAHADAAAELAAVFSDDESLLGALPPVAPPLAAAGKPPPAEDAALAGSGRNGAYRSPPASRRSEENNHRFSAGGASATDDQSWTRGSVSRDDAYTDDLALDPYRDHYTDRSRGALDDRASEQGSAYAPGWDGRHLGARTDAASSEAGRGGSVESLPQGGSGLEKSYQYQHSMGSSVHAQPPSLHAPSEVHSEMPDDSASVPSHPLYPLPLYHNSVIPEVTEMGPMDEPHEVPVLPPMHTEVEPTDRQFYTVHDVAQMEGSRRRLGSMSVDVEIASTTAQSDTGSQPEQRFSGNGSARGAGGMFGGGGAGGAAPSNRGSPASGSDHGQDPHGGAGAAVEQRERPADHAALSHLAALMAELQGALGGAAAAAADAHDGPLQQRLREYEERNAGLLDELNMRKIAQVRAEDQQGIITPNYSHLSTPLKSEGGWQASYLSPGAISAMSTPAKQQQDTLRLQLRLRQQGAPNPLFQEDGAVGGGGALAALQQQLAQADAALAELAADNAALAELAADNAALAERAAASERRVSSQDEHIATLEGQLATLQSQLEAVQAQAASSSSHSQVAQLQAQLEAQQAAFEELRADHEDLLACLGQESAKVEALAEELRQFGFDVDALIAQVEDTTGFENEDDDGDDENA